MQQFERKEFEKILKKNGYVVTRHNGSHIIYSKPGNNHISIPGGKKTINGCMAKRLIKEMGEN